MCQIDQREGTVSFAVIRRVLRELFAKKHGGSIRPPPLQVRGLKLIVWTKIIYSIQFSVRVQ